MTCEKERLMDVTAVITRSLTVIKPTQISIGALKLELLNNTLIFTINEREFTIRAEISTTIEEDGECVVPGKLFFNALSSLEEGKVVLKSIDNVVYLSCGKTNFAINTLQNGFLWKNITTETVPISLNAYEFNHAIRQVIEAASTDEARPALTGILMKFDNDNVDMVATDSYRLTLSNISINSSINDKQIIIPSKSLLELQRIISTHKQYTEKDEVLLEITEFEVKFTYKNFILISSLISAKYPNYQPLIPENTTVSFRGSRSDLISTLRRAKVLAPDTASVIKFNFSQNTVKIGLKAMDGSLLEEVYGEYSGEDINISFNLIYLLDGIEACDGDQITIHFNDNSNPVIIKGKDENFTYILMPVRSLS